ncbi:sensor domain-containing protein [Micrococcales bacterium 31B]|nr:sensor domain-containing protein [Micrococcales bacterium 31B]
MYVDLRYIASGFLLSIASFIVLLVLFSVGVSTLVVWVGLPVLLGCLSRARAFADTNREALRRRDGAVPPVVYAPPQPRTVSGSIKSLSDPQLWRDLVHGTVVSFVYRTCGFCVAVTWLAVAFGGLTLWSWGYFLPHREDTGLAHILFIDSTFGMSTQAADGLLGIAYGLAFLVTLPGVLRGVAHADAAIARDLLTNETAALRARSDDLQRSRARVVAEEASTLRKIESDLHDGPQQRLIRLHMDVESAARKLQHDPAAARALMEGALEQSREALAEIRALSRGIAPPLLTDRGLGAAASALAARATVPVHVTSTLEAEQRLPESVENAAYFVLSEALANVAKHSGASQAQVRLSCTPSMLEVSVRDDGVGGAHPEKGHGLRGLADRLAGVDGTLQVASPGGGPTVISARIPLGADAVR